MPIDFCAIPNIQSDISSSVNNAAKGSPGNSRVEKPTGTDSGENDFRSNLKRAESVRETDSQRADKGDGSVEKSEHQSPGGPNEKRASKTSEDHHSTENRHPQTTEIVNGDDAETSAEVTPAYIEPETFDSTLVADFVAQSTNTEKPGETLEEASLKLEGEEKPSFTTISAANPAPSAVGSSEPDSGASSVFNTGKADSSSVSATPAIDDSVPINPAPNTKSAQSAAEQAVKSEVAEGATLHQQNGVSDKPSPETQKILTRHDHPTQTSDSIFEVPADKTLADGQAGSERQASDIQKRMGSNSTVSTNAPVTENAHDNKALDGSTERPEVHRYARMAVDTEHSPQAGKTSAAHNDIGGSQDATQASATKTGADVEQNVKTNDLIPPPQRPVVGDGSAPLRSENVDIRPHAPKADVLNQIVDRAVFKLNNEQAEVRIDLKPDFLGHVRLQIVTESHQVNLRILAESSIVKELIDGNLGQLKNDLQSQGLKVDEIDVSVAKDFNEFNSKQDFTAHGGPGKRGFAFKGQNNNANELPDSDRVSAGLMSRSGGIDCFA